MTHADRINYREYQRMLVELHAMIAGGLGDSAKAMELREQMEGTEASLSETDVLRLNALSGDLSMTHDREIPDPDIVARVPAADLARMLVLAYERKDWEELLALLRADVSHFLRPDQVAYMRARAYEALGEMAPAVAFMDEAARRDATNANYRALAMELLWSDKRYDEAYGRAQAYLSNPSTPDRLVLMAGGIVSRRAQQDHVPRDLMSTATSALKRLERAVPGESSPNIRFAGFGTLGLLAAHVGDGTKAESALLQALDETGAATQFATRGLLLDELKLIRGGRLRSPEERSLSRQLADILAPGRYALAA